MNSLNYLVRPRAYRFVFQEVTTRPTDQELSLLGGAYNTIGAITGERTTMGHCVQSMEPFMTSTVSSLVTRLTGYTVETALGLTNASKALATSTFVHDLATNRNNSGYKFWNDDLYTANTTLNNVSAVLLMRKRNSSPTSRTSWGTLVGRGDSN